MYLLSEIAMKVPDLSISFLTSLSLRTLSALCSDCLI